MTLLAEKISARDVIEAVLAMKEDPKLKCCFILWYRWAERNRIRDGEKEREASSLAHGIQVYMASRCSGGSQLQDIETPAKPPVRRAWERPPENHVKVNCDAAFDLYTGSGGWGCILRDSDGDAVAARRGRLDALLESLQGEIIACIHPGRTGCN